MKLTFQYFTRVEFVVCQDLNSLKSNVFLMINRQAFSSMTVSARLRTVLGFSKMIKILLSVALLKIQSLLLCLKPLQFPSSHGLLPICNIIIFLVFYLRSPVGRSHCLFSVYLLTSILDVCYTQCQFVKNMYGAFIQ